MCRYTLPRTKSGPRCPVLTPTSSSLSEELSATITIKNGTDPHHGVSGAVLLISRPDMSANAAFVEKISSRGDVRGS